MREEVEELGVDTSISSRVATYIRWRVTAALLGGMTIGMILIIFLLATSVN